MNAIKFETLIDEEVAGALPKLRPLLGRKVEVIALETEPPTPTKRTVTLEQFLAHRLERPAGVPPVSLEDMERAILRGALGDDV